MQDPEIIFRDLQLKHGDCFVDLGCGPGDYSLHASRLIGDAGRVYALDRFQSTVEALTVEAASQGCGNVTVLVADLARPLPLEDGRADVCFMATVLHALNVVAVGPVLFPEIIRVLKPGGSLAVVECKKEDRPWGPPKHVRLSPKQVEAMVGPYGFERVGLVDLGKNYLVRFRVK